ncbi:MAG: DUF1917 domain-containing protein [Methanomicrobiaceae archaeon]|nr:DUF1917 domain-containing protein [Methanomicrobiaceae archaeon]
MEGTVDTGLADVAYGLFEILLNRELRERGTYLFERVEKEEDFREDFEEIFGIFQADYPELAKALVESCGGTAALYTMLREGEGVVPGRTTRMYWIIQDAPDFRPGAVDDERGGKWLIFIDRDHADEIWRRIRDATADGRLGISAKVSTAKTNPESRDERVVIYVHTTDWEDEDDVMRVREVLRSLGIDQRIGYKRNLETYHGEYSEKGKKVTFYSA